MSRRGYALTIFLVLLVCYTYFFPRWADWAQNARMDLVLAVVDRHTLSIDDYYNNTGDYAYFEGHYYADKSPGPSLLALPVYQVFKWVATLPPVARLMEHAASSEAFATTLEEGGTGASADKVYFAAALYAVTFFVVSVPSALLGVAFFYFAASFARKDAHAFWLALAYGLATPAFPYSGYFGQHQIGAACAFTSFWLLYRLRQRQEDAARTLWLVGALFGLAVVTEYPIVLILAPLFFYALYVIERKREIWRVIASALPFGLVMMAYNLATFKTPLPVGYLYSPNYTDLHHEGLVSLTYPRLPALWEITFGPFRGLFFVSPFLLFGFLGLWYLWGQRAHRAEWWVLLVSVVSFILYNASSAMWQGGHAVGPRYLVPMLPFLALPIVLVLNRWAERKWARVGIAGVMLLSGALVWAETIAGQHFPDWSRNPLAEVSVPRLLEGDIARNLGMLLGLQGWLSLAPLALVIGLGYGVYVLARSGSSPITVEESNP
jgi:4-amino-4-deoxy-L-arabinose transferase-like glycosyltransferase